MPRALEQTPLTRGMHLQMPLGKLPNILSEGNCPRSYRLLTGPTICLVCRRSQLRSHTRRTSLVDCHLFGSVHAGERCVSMRVPQSFTGSVKVIEECICY